MPMLLYSIISIPHSIKFKLDNLISRWEKFVGASAATLVIAVTAKRSILILVFILAIRGF